MHLPTYNHKTLKHRKFLHIFMAYDSYRHIYLYVLTNVVTDVMVSIFYPQNILILIHEF